MAGHQRHPSSFRDPDSSIVCADGELLRVFSKQGAADMRRFLATPTFAEATARGQIVEVDVLDDHSLGQSLVLRPRELSPWSVPCEWSFSMLRDAALLHLELLRSAMDDGLMMKDATSFNITFAGTRPVFVDHGSFVPWADGQPWHAYLQFCEHFLFPLMVRAYGGIDAQPWLRSSIRGIEADTASRVLGWRATRRPGIALHVRLNAVLQRRYLKRPPDATPRVDRLPPAAVRATVEKVRRVVERTAWKQASSTWSKYSKRDHYDTADLTVKQRFVETALARAPLHTVLDVGCNDGRFSDLAARHATTVVAIDADHLAVDQLYGRLRDGGPTNVVPLVVDVLNPTPASGWLGQERTGFFDRVRPDAVLLLAVVHHLAITGGVPLEQLGAWMRSFACPLVVEFPDETDEKVRQLLEHTKAGRTWEYSLARFSEVLANKGFTIRRRELLPSGTRTMFEISSG